MSLNITNKVNVKALKSLKILSDVEVYLLETLSNEVGINIKS